MEARSEIVFSGVTVVKGRMFGKSGYGGYGTEKLGNTPGGAIEI